MGVLSRGMAFLGRVGAETNSETVTYKRVGFSPAFTVAAVIGGRAFDQEDGVNLPTRLAKDDVDFIIRVTDFDTAAVAAGLEAFEPAIGDKVTRSGKDYRVYADGAIPEWDWGEAERLTYRIHTRAET